MRLNHSALRQLGCNTVSRRGLTTRSQSRRLTTNLITTSAVPTKPFNKQIKALFPSQAIRKKCPDPVGAVIASQIHKLDPTGARTWLFRKSNIDGAQVGDVLLVRQRNGDPFAGVCINIRRRGTDTSILLRGQLTRIGVEMWFKIYSPNVEGIEIVKKRERRPRRARLYYMRKPKHDMGSVEGVVRRHQQRLRMLGATTQGGPYQPKKKATRK